MTPEEALLKSEIQWMQIDKENLHKKPSLPGITNNCYLCAYANSIAGGLPCSSLCPAYPEFLEAVPDPVFNTAICEQEGSPYESWKKDHDAAPFLVLLRNAKRRLARESERANSFFIRHLEPGMEVFTIDEGWDKVSEVTSKGVIVDSTFYRKDGCLFEEQAHPELYCYNPFKPKTVPVQAPWVHPLAYPDKLSDLGYLWSPRHAWGVIEAWHLNTDTKRITTKVQFKDCWRTLESCPCGNGKYYPLSMLFLRNLFTGEDITDKELAELKSANDPQSQTVAGITAAYHGDLESLMAENSHPKPLKSPMRVGQYVWSYSYGWGILAGTEGSEHVVVCFPEIVLYTPEEIEDGKLYTTTPTGSCGPYEGFAKELQEVADKYIATKDHKIVVIKRNSKTCYAKYVHCGIGTMECFVEIDGKTHKVPYHRDLNESERDYASKFGNDALLAINTIE